MRSFGLTSSQNAEQLELRPRFVPAAQQVEDDVADAGAQELVDGRRDLVGMAEGAVALGRAPEVHRVATAQDPGRVVEGAVAAVVDADEEQVRGVESLDGAVRVPRRGLDRLQALPIALWGHDVAYPAVRLAPDAAKRRLPACPAPDRRTAGRERRRLHVNVLELEEPAVEGHRLTGPRRAHDVDGLVEPCPAFLHGDAAGIELSGELAADARPEHEATAQEMVDRDDLLRGRGE